MTLSSVSSIQDRQDGANPSSPYYPALDGLRALAVLFVFFGHYRGFHPGWMGVNIFFVLSGFLITGILFDGQDKPHRFRNFYVRRTLRIFPLYYALWITLFLATPILHIAWHPVNFLWPAYLGNWIPLISLWRPYDYQLHLVAVYQFATGLSRSYSINTGHFWSLCIEEQFYLLWPLIVFHVRKRSTLVLICWSAIFFVPLARIACICFASPEFVANGALHNFTFLRLDEFLVGGLGALLLRGPEATRLRAAGSWLFWVPLTMLIACGLYGLVFHRSDLIVSNRWILSCGITLVDVLALGMILLCLDTRSWLARLFQFAPARGLGRISYGFYVFHDIPHAAYMYLIKHLGLSPKGFGLIIPLAGTIVISIASYNLLERPFLKLKTRFEGDRRVNVG